MRPGQTVSRLSSLTLLPVGVMLLGCNTLVTAPLESLPQMSSGSSSASAPPLDASPTKDMDSVALEEANSIYFAKGATRIDRTEQNKLRIHAARLKENPVQVVTLAGYTDDLGSDSYNLAIAEQRIEAVAKLLRTYGVPKKQIQPLRRYSVGRAGSMAACRTTDCRQKMRRVELIYGNR